MRRYAIAVVTLVTLCGPTLAADLRGPFVPSAAPPEPSWTGFYAGINAGGAVANGHLDFSLAGLPAFASVDNNLSGAVGGVQGGYNWQNGPLLLGFETDAQLSGLRGELTAPCPPGFCGPPALAASYKQEVPWFGTVRGRVGYATPGWFAYGTAGFAYGRLDTKASATAGGLTATFDSGDTRTGWTAGVGIEVAFAPNWSAKLEYLHLDLGDRSFNWVLVPLPPITDRTDLTLDVVRAGVNYRF